MGSRREFIKDSLGITGLALCGASSVLLEGCTSLTYINPTLDGNRLVVSKIELLDNKFVLVDHSKLLAPVHLSKTSESEYMAMLLLCTHKGCDVKPAGSIFVCPCHGSEFNSKGAVLQGPAEEALQLYTTTTDNENIYINLK